MFGEPPSRPVFWRGIHLMRISLRHTLAAITLTSLTLTTTAVAAVVAIDNFESYALDVAPTTVAGSNWTGGTNGDQFLVVADPTGATNKVLDRTSGGQYSVLFNSVPEVADGQTGTLFFRALTGGGGYGTLDLKLGLAPANANTNDMDLNYAAGVSSAKD